MEMIVLGLLVVGGIVAYRAVTADRAGGDLAWSGSPMPVAGSTTGDAASGTRAVYRGSGTAAPLRTARALARIEAKRLLASPLLIVGLVLMSLLYLTALDAGIGDESEWLRYSARYLPLALYPACGMVLLATNRAALRARRDGTVELFDSLPTSPSTRSAGLYLALAGPALYGVAIAAVGAFCTWWGSGKGVGAGLFERSALHPPFADVGATNVVAAAVLVVCAGALGIALARLLPWGLVAVAALVVVGILTGTLNHDSLPRLISDLSPWVGPRALPATLAPLAQGWHVLYLVGLAAVAAGSTFLLDGNRRWGAAWLATAAVLLAVSITGQSRVYAGGTAADLAALITAPRTHDVCVGAEGARVCAIGELRPVAERWAALASVVRLAAPDEAAAGPVLVHLRVSPAEVAQLDPAVQDEVDARGGAYGWVGEPGLHPDLRWGEADGAPFRAMLVAHELVGLPEPEGPGTPSCYAGGQARAAIAVALAGRALPEDDRGGLRSVATGGVRTETGNDYGDDAVTDLAPEDWDTDTEPVVVHSESDLGVGRAMLLLPEDEVRARLVEDWAHWVDPATPTAELAAAFQLDARRATAPAPQGVAPCE